MIERIEKSRRKLEVVRQSTRRKLRELKDAEEKLELFNISIQEKADDIRVIERELHERLKGIEAKEKKCEHFFSELKVKETQVEDHSKELALRDEHFSGRFIELELKLELKEENLGERCAELKLKYEKVEERFKELELKEKHIQTRCEEMELENKKLMEQCEELELKEKQLENRCRELELIDKEFTERVKEFELEERQLEERFKKFYLKEKQLVNSHMKLVKIEPPQSHANIHFSDRKSLQMFLNDHCKDHDLMRNEVLNALGLSSDPTKLVLDAMEGLYPFNLKKGDFVFEKALCRTFSPGLGIFAALATYGLASAFDTDELLIHLEIVAPHAQAPELFRVLDLTEKISGFLQNLIKKNQYIEAIRFIYAFELVNEFPPVPLLENYLEDSRSVARKGWRGKSIQAQGSTTGPASAPSQQQGRTKGPWTAVSVNDDPSAFVDAASAITSSSPSIANSTATPASTPETVASSPATAITDPITTFSPSTGASTAAYASAFSSSATTLSTVGHITAASISPAISSPLATIPKTGTDKQVSKKHPRIAVSVNEYDDLSTFVGAASAITTSSPPIANSTATPANTHETVASSSPATAITDPITTACPPTGASTAALLLPFSSFATAVITVRPITATSISPTVSLPLAIPKTGTENQPASLFMVHGAPYLNTTARHHSLRGYPPLNL
ncbi:hypothetical protein GH714_024166 [Hevea brasiliensis]|uniref:FRIGIDA-like protein n=1 Tax=Hevea brasiliensis TaxID=3981 RepID=A0A6A6LAY4_HEVBR|nr:hypothetical protein GH714_024166 [Hevea brasiliensis]